MQRSVSGQNRAVSVLSLIFSRPPRNRYFHSRARARAMHDRLNYAVESRAIEEASSQDRGYERKKRSTIWSFFVVDNDDKAKAVCLTCKEKVSRGGSNPKSFNTSNLRKHLEGHEDKFQEYVAREKKK